MIRSIAKLREMISILMWDSPEDRIEALNFLTELRQLLCLAMVAEQTGFNMPSDWLARAEQVCAEWPTRPIIPDLLLSPSGMMEWRLVRTATQCNVPAALLKVASLFQEAQQRELIEAARLCERAPHAQNLEAVRSTVHTIAHTCEPTSAGYAAGHAAAYAAQNAHAARVVLDVLQREKQSH